MKKKVIIYGSASCHKTNYYMDYLSERNIEYTFHDVIKNQKAATELRGYYETGKLNFPTLIINDKKLRNPSNMELAKWLSIKLCH